MRPTVSMRFQRGLLALALLLSAAACTALPRPRGVPAKVDPERVPAALERAGAELAEGKVVRAFFWAKAARAVPELPSDLRIAATALFERSAEALIERYSRPGSDPDVLEEVFDEHDLPQPLAARAAVESARLWLAREERWEAFTVVKKLDQRFPFHPLRQEAGDLLATVGFSFADDEGSYGLFFDYRDLAPPVLEYLVLTYPSHRRCDLAYHVLAEIYEEQRAWLVAIERQQDLILWHPGSPYVTWAKARIPHLRLALLESPEYDQSFLERALGEYERWLAEHPGHELQPTVAAERLDCLRRLADSHLGIARFYVEVENPPGALHHARLAVEHARAGGLDAQVAEAEALVTLLEPGEGA